MCAYLSLVGSPPPLPRVTAWACAWQSGALLVRSMLPHQSGFAGCCILAGIGDTMVLFLEQPSGVVLSRQVAMYVAIWLGVAEKTQFT